MSKLSSQQVIRAYNLFVLGDVKMDKHISKCIAEINKHYSMINKYIIEDDGFIAEFYGSGKDYIYFNYSNIELKVYGFRIPNEVKNKYKFSEDDFHYLITWFLKNTLKIEDDIKVRFSYDISTDMKYMKFIKTFDLKLCI